MAIEKPASGTRGARTPPKLVGKLETAALDELGLRRAVVGGR